MILPTPYLIFLGDTQERVYAKTGQGLVDWSPEKCLGQYRLPLCTIDLGLPDMTIAQARAAGVQSFVIGIAPVGGSIKEEWIAIFREALLAGLNIINGLHTQMADLPGIREIINDAPGRIYQVRTPPTDIAIGTGKRRTGKRLLMVGTDCGVGKKYSALCIHKALNQRGLKSTFRATGQTGIMISGGGIPMDAVIADFISGAAEMLSPDNDPDHWDVIEGQGALHHPGYAAVSLGILHGSQPDALILCHEATRKEMDGFEGYFIGNLSQRMEEALAYGRVTNPNIKGVGISVNTAWLPEDKREQYLNEIEKEIGIPCVDPMVGNLDPIIDKLMAM